jgi:4-hydroxy-3-methylbut-2-enyl diphosphate reductase
MKIRVAKNSGFCSGVKRAVDLAFEASKANERVYTYGPIVHNEQVVEKLKNIGVETINELNDGINGTVIIRSHGISPKEYNILEDRAIYFIDGTCPLVKKIHKDVEEYKKQGYHMVIIGDKDHPEVKGIIGFAGEDYTVINGIDDISNIPLYSNIVVVSQTTYLREKWQTITERIKEVIKDAVIIDTICYATKNRQLETEKLAKESDLMLIIGGRDSSNTKKLCEISKKYCDSHWIQTDKDINPEWFNNKKNIGITAGASTPQWIIEEVVRKMDELNVNPEVEKNEDMAENYEMTIKKLHTGQIIEGTVVKVTDTEIMVNVGYKSEGIVPANELSYISKENPTEGINEGDQIKVYVVKIDDGEGNLILSKRKADSEIAWEEAEKSLEEKTAVSVKIVEEVKGGVIADFYGLKAFMPASHIDITFAPDLKAYIGQMVSAKVIEMEKGKNRIVLSRKASIEEEQRKKKEETWNRIEEGMVVDGVVRRLTNFGAFVDIGGVDGLIHISELSWGRINHPGEVVAEGEPVKVKILKLDKGKDRISLGLKQVTPNPWDSIHERFKVNGVYEGKVARTVSFGAFIELEPGVEGLVHISQISSDHVEKVEDMLKTGQNVMVKILDINSIDHKMSLSIKDAIEKPKHEYKNQQDSGNITIGEMFSELFEEKGHFEDL